MPIATGPIFREFKSVLERAGRPLARDTEECSVSVVRLLESYAADQRAGMLLGKVQSGKTRAFVGAIAIAFDSGFDIAIVLTKTSKPLAAQTKRRLETDLGDSIANHRIVIFDAAARVGPLNEWQQDRKVILVAKKHRKNLENVQRLLDEHPRLREKRAFIVDDEADFASVGYERRQGDVFVRRVQTLINTIRTRLANSVYLEVTATPYSLYLQPADIAEPATGQQFQGVRPAFTKLVKPHDNYIGGDFYFDKAEEPGTIASFIHVSVPDAELAAMRQPVAVAERALLTSAGLNSLRRALITFVIGGVMRRLDEQVPDQPERLFSFIVHLERLRDAHTDQQQLAQRLIDALKNASLETPPVGLQLSAAYEDLRRSRNAGGFPTRPLKNLLPHIRSAFASISAEVVNSDSQLERLLDNSGQLRQQSPLNIYIGGQSLDRGVTIANVIGFYYGRDPRVAQQDTTIQHCRMYGDRTPGDLTVTRFYTSPGIYARMKRMHEFDKLLWHQLRLKDEGIDQVYERGDVVFVARDTTGEVRSCAPSKITLSKIQWVSSSGELVPYPFSTVSSDPNEPAALELRQRLLSLGKPSRAFNMSIADACELLDDVCDLIRIDDGWDWDFEAMKDVLRFVASLHPDESQRESVAVLYTLGNNMPKWRNAEQTDAQRSPYNRTMERRVRDAAGMSPAIALFENNGTANGWGGSPFVWPTVFIPIGTPATVFANNRRSRGGRRSRRNRRARA